MAASTACTTTAVLSSATTPGRCVSATSACGGRTFVYDYDLGALWRHDLRVEQITDPEPGRAYPRCTGGRRAGPPENCGGPEAFMHASQPCRLFEVMDKVTEIIDEIVDDVSRPRRSLRGAGLPAPMAVDGTL